MIGYGSLFECLNGDVDKCVGWSCEVFVMVLVVVYLGKMFSIWVGSVQMLFDYGLFDFNDMCLSLYDFLSQVCLVIEGFIEVYELCLSDVCVVFLLCDNDQFCLVFSIEGLLEVGGFKCQVSFFVCLDGSGQVKVS